MCTYYWEEKREDIMSRLPRYSTCGPLSNKMMSNTARKANCIVHSSSWTGRTCFLLGAIEKFEQRLVLAKLNIGSDVCSCLKTNSGQTNLFRKSIFLTKQISTFKCTLITHTCTNTHARVRAHTYAHTHTHAHAHTHTFTQTDAYTHTYTYTYTHTHAPKHTQNTHIHSYTHTHTHTHSRTQKCNPTNNSRPIMIRSCES